MNIKIKKEFITLWKKYFNNAELPITFYYTDEEGHAELVKPGSVSRCIIGALSNVRKGKSFSFSIESIGCFGGKRYLFLKRPPGSLYSRDGICSMNLMNRKS